MAFVISGDGGQWRFNCSSVDTPEAFDKLRALPRHYYSWLGQSIRRRGIFIAPHVRQAVEWPRLHSLEVADENRRKWPGKEDGNLSGEVSGLEFTLNRPILSFKYDANARRKSWKFVFLLSRVSVKRRRFQNGNNGGLGTLWRNKNLSMNTKLKLCRPNN